MKKVLSMILISLLLSFACFSGCSEGGADPSVTDANQQASSTQPGQAQTGEPNGEEEADPSTLSDAELAATLPNMYVPEKLARGMEVHVAWPSMQLDDQFNVMMSNGLRDDLEPLGYTVTITSFNGDVSLQLQQIENFLTLGTACIVTSMNDPDSGVDLCKKCEEAGCYFIQQGSVPNGYVSGAINVDQTDIGRRQVEMAVAWIDQVYGDVPDGSIHVAFVGNTTNEDPAVRTAAVEAAIAEDPRQQLVFTNHNSLGIDVAYTAVEEAFTYDSEIKIVYTFNATQAIGANNYVIALPNADLSRYAIFANNYNADALALIEQSDENDGSVIRGTIAFGADPAWGNLTLAVTGLLDGSYTPGTVTWEPNWAICSFDFSY